MTAEMRADWVDPDALRLLLTAMMPANALAMEVAMSTGLRIGDVLAIRTEQARKPRFTIKEEKTGKARRIYLPRKLRERMFEQAGRFYVWEGRRSTVLVRPFTRIWRGWRSFIGWTGASSRSM